MDLSKVRRGLGLVLISLVLTVLGTIFVSIVPAIWQNNQKALTVAVVTVLSLIVFFSFLSFIGLMVVGFSGSVAFFIAAACILGSIGVQIASVVVSSKGQTVPGYYDAISSSFSTITTVCMILGFIRVGKETSSGNVLNYITLVIMTAIGILIAVLNVLPYFGVNLGQDANSNILIATSALSIFGYLFLLIALIKTWNRARVNS